MTELIEFDTERLRLRQWIESDREHFARLCADPKVMEFFPNLLDRGFSNAMVDRIQTLINESGWGLWAVETQADRQFIGFVGLQVPNAALPYSPCVEIGWRLAYEYWGKGYATEAARGVLEVGFDRLNLPEIVSFTATINRRSYALMERLGMNREDTTFEHPLVPVGHRLREHYLYRLSREKWQSDRQNRTLET
jgi:RimJ/RimL family protein N-acetyltransferase